jgi:mannose-6-phosphate isomerase-like protein (cupin superfamily)
MENHSDKTIRSWGYYRVLHTVGSGVKVKELTVEPGKTLSMQRHFYRSELWFVAEGIATLYSLEDNEKTHIGDYGLFQSLTINTEDWHQLANEQDFDLKVIEIQYGDKCIEEDIERKIVEGT